MEPASIVTVLTGLFAGFRFVREGEKGSISRFGKARRNNDGKIKVVNPGIVFFIPFVDSINRIHMRIRTLEYANLSATLTNGLSYKYEVFIIYKVIDNPDDIEKALYLVENLPAAVGSQIQKAAWEFVSSAASRSEVTNEKFSKIAKEKLDEFFKRDFGVEIESCGINHFTESEQSQQATMINHKFVLAKEHLDKLPHGIVAACVGAVPTVPTSSQKQEGSAPITSGDE